MLESIDEPTQQILKTLSLEYGGSNFLKKTLYLSVSPDAITTKRPTPVTSPQ